MKFTSIEEHIMGIVCSVFDAYSAVLFLPEEDGGGFYLAAAFSLGDKIAENVKITPGKGLVGWIVENRHPMLVTDVDKRESREGILGYYTSDTAAGIKAFMGFPLPTGGALCVDSKRQYSFTEKDYKILQLFAELMARLQNISQKDISGDITRYFAELGVIQDLRFRYRHWPSLLKNFLRTISKATEFDYCAFATLQEDGEYYSLECESAPLLLANGQELHIPVSSGITGWVFLHEQAVFEEGGLASTSALFGKIPDMPDFPAAICMPVMINKTCRCVLCLANTEPREIDESLRSFVRQAVDNLSLFLENLYLKTRLSHFLQKARINREGGRVYNPDNPPPQENEDDDNN